MEAEYKINPIPMKTWNWLKVNDAKVCFDNDELLELSKDALNIKVEGDVKETALNPSLFNDMEDGTGTDTNIIRSACVRKGVSFETLAEGKLFINPKLTKDGAFEVLVNAREGANLTVIEEITSEDEGFGFASVKFNIEDNAKVTLVQIYKTGAEYKLITNVSACEGKCASFNIVQLFMKGGEIYAGLASKLLGNESDLKLNSAYLVNDSRKLDINYVVRHVGKNTHCDMSTQGALKTNAYKCFRGTIDFIKGASGSKGNVLENVLFLDDTAVNRTTPIILCGEEDVEGNHGATVGKISEDILFYMESRGITEEEIYRMMAAASLMSVAGRIPEEAVRNRIIEELEEN